MLLVCLVAYQYIDTQKDHHVFREETHGLLDEDSGDVPRSKGGIPKGVSLRRHP
jgi:hypothetical protein